MKSFAVFLAASQLLVLVSFSFAHEHSDQNAGPIDQVAMEDRVFKTSKHHGYRAFYTLPTNRQPQPQQSQMPRWPQTSGRQQNYGVWYPNQNPQTHYTVSTGQNQAPEPSHRDSAFGGGRRGDPSLPLPDQLRARRFNKLLDLIDMADLTRTLSSARQSFTLFAPTDGAIVEFLDSQPEGVVESLTEEIDVLKSLLLHHVVPGQLSEMDLSDGQKIMNLGGKTLEILDTKDGRTVNGAKLLIDEGMVDIKAGNGYIHAIDRVLYPFESEDEMVKPKRKRLLAVDDDDPELMKKTAKGMIRGINLSEDVRAWLGVPYAKPPLDKLRFAPPEEPESWEDEEEPVETRKLPSACMQAPDTAFGEFEGATLWNPNTDISEDCLYLNIHAPRNISKPLPVLVWIYGGGYTTGSMALDIYDPTTFVSGKDIIFVAMQYRVGAHGFLYFGSNSGAPGNVGMLDQVMALNWVKDNIQEFGGNPEDITLMGESAGANSVALHLVSPLSCNLFNKAILQSSGMNPRWGYLDNKDALRRAEKLAETLDCTVFPRFPEDTVSCLREKDPQSIVDALYSVEDYTVNLFPFVPTKDKNFLPASPERLLAEKAFAKDKRVLIGTNANEGYWSLMYYLTDLMPNRELTKEEMMMTDDQYMEAVDSVFSFYPEGIRRLIAHEYHDLFPRDDSAGKFKALDQMVADSDFVCDSEHLAQTLANNGNDVFRYHFAHMSSQNPWPSFSGVKHGDELEFTFGGPLNDPQMYSSKEVSFAYDLNVYWTNFVKTGNPNPSIFLESWPKYSGPEWSYLNLTAESNGGSAGEKQFRDKCNFWNSVLPSVVKTEADEEEARRKRRQNEDEDDDVDFSVCQ